MTQTDPDFQEALMQSFSDVRLPQERLPARDPEQDSLTQLRGDMNTSFAHLRGEVREGFAKSQLYTSEQVRGATDGLRQEVTQVREVVGEVRGKLTGIYWAIGIAAALLAAVTTIVVAILG